MNRLRLILCGVISQFATVARADDVQPLYVEIIETNISVFSVQARLPPQIPEPFAPSLVLPAFCEGQQLQLSSRRQSVACAKDLAGERLTLRFRSQVAQTPSIIRIRYRSGQSHTVLLASDASDWVMPDRETKTSVASQYMWLGMHHIWAGSDHLLFLVCLMFIARTWRRILVTVTGFTLAHSVTLVLSALDVVRIPIPPTEAVIALSVLFLAREVCVGERNSLAWRYPVAVSTTFGLLHGLGFAAVLKEVGLPQLELVTGLLCFNIGVEIGQLVFVSAVALALILLARWWPRSLDASGLLRYAMAYGVGSISAFWVIERTAGFLF